MWLSSHVKFNKLFANVKFYLLFSSPAHNYNDEIVLTTPIKHLLYLACNFV